jgi:hypothetical protein
MDTQHQPLPRQTKMVRNLKKMIQWEKNVIQNGVFESIYINIMQCESTKDIWNKLNTIYEGDEKVEEKLQIFRAKFE